MFKVNNRNTRKRCEICSQLTIKTAERRLWRRSGVFIVNFQHISRLFLVFPLLTLIKLMLAGQPHLPTIRESLRWLNLTQKLLGVPRSFQFWVNRYTTVSLSLLFLDQAVMLLLVQGMYTELQYWNVFNSSTKLNVLVHGTCSGICFCYFNQLKAKSVFQEEGEFLLLNKWYWGVGDTHWH